MKLPKIFIPEKNLEGKTEELLTPKDPKKLDITFSDYHQIRYTTEGTSWAIEYEKHKNSKRWVLYDKDFYENKWFVNTNLDERAKKILKDRISPLVELLNLKEKGYSIEKDNFRTILDRYVKKVSEGKEHTEDQEHGKCTVILYEKGLQIIELKEFERTYIGRIDLLE